MNDGHDAFRLAITATLGHAPDAIETDKLVRFCTGGKKGDRSGWCRLFPDGRAGVFGCFRMGVSEVWTPTPRESMSAAERGELRRQMARDRAQRETVQREAWRRNADLIRFLMRQSQPVTAGDPVHTYLCRRLALDSIVVPECIRVHRSMAYTLDGELVGSWPAMVAPLMNQRGDVLALHRTYLDEHGQKAAVPGPAKKLTPAAGLLSGVSMPLFAPQSGTIGVAEGIETALAAYSASAAPTVAAYSAGGVAAFLWPAGIERLMIFADHDDAGANAAARLRERGQRSGLTVSVMTPTEPGSDWCDVWASRAVVEVQA